MVGFVFYFVYIILIALGLQYAVWGRCVNAVIVVFIPTFTFLMEIALPAYKW